MAQFKAHKHAERMGKYAGDARQTQEPWKRWQVKLGDNWVDLDTHPAWDEGAEYRRKDMPFRSEAWAAHNAAINAKKPPLGKGPKPVIGSMYSPLIRSSQTTKAAAISHYKKHRYVRIAVDIILFFVLAILFIYFIKA